jgi:signal-transduction protein with cAMP-binding, CBS, and nucleotidyltransferase domain
LSLNDTLPLIRLNPSATVIEAAELMIAEQSPDIYVVDAESKPVGVVRYRDVVESVAKGLRPLKTEVREIMLQPPPMVEEYATVEEISKILTKTEMRRILVRRGREIIGVIETGELFSLVSSSLERVEIFKAISVRTRLRMAELLSIKSMGVEDLAEELGIKPITVRYHLDVLRRNGIIEEVQEERFGKVGRPLSLFRTNRSVLRRGALPSGSVTM